MPLRSRAPLGLERLRGLWTPMRPFHSRSWTKERPGELDEVTERCCAAGRDGCTRIPPHSKYFQGYTLAFFGQNSLSYVCTYYMYVHVHVYIHVHTCTVELVMPQTQSSVYISKSSFRLTYSLKMARGIFGADVLTSSNFQDFVCNV